MPTVQETFLVDCDSCKAKVAAVQQGIAEKGIEVYDNEPYGGSRLYVGSCPKCTKLIAAHSIQLAIADVDAEEDEWSDPVRVFPSPSRVLSHRVPKLVRESMSDAEACLQAGVHVPAFVMLGKALEGLCRDQLRTEIATAEAAAGKPVRFMLEKALGELRTKEVIDDKLLAWSKQLQAFRNSAAHSDEDASLTRADAMDLRTFAYAIIEYVYDLTERYNEFVARIEADKAKKAAKKTAKGNDELPW